ncbi:MAG: hypothetical protein LBU34_03030 [Planctomycetaceae bacterium]|jgi:hypothetical protein|nr:hypothetical protein [Planctomycetaceae bacterium]
MTKISENKQSLIQHLASGVVIVLICLLFFILLYPIIYYKESGEHLPVPDDFPQDAADYCYYRDLVIVLYEFNLPKDSFLKYCEKEKWEIEDIEKMEIIKYMPNKSFSTRRYIYPLKPEHHECTSSECKIEPTGRTENSCIRFVSKGYCYEEYYRAGRGFTVVYDSENERYYCKRMLR